MINKINIPIFPKLFKTNSFCQLYESIEYFNLKVNNKNVDSDFNTDRKGFYSHRLVPEYFLLNLRDTAFKTKIIPEFNWGYSVLLKPSDSIDGFMQRQFNSKKRNIITRNVKRLETCFDIKYKMFYGDISKSDYSFIMQSLNNMIIERFKERNELHKNLHEWEDILESSYSEILDKKASLFVIYNEDEPIEISLNYHFDKILFSYISSYDIDYSKFGLGHVEIYKQLEWCANNNYRLFEMGVGGMDYKRRWSNNIYRYKHYIVYKKQSIKLQLFIAKTQLKEYLKSKKLNEIYPKMRIFFSKKRKEQKQATVFSIMQNDSLCTNGYEKIEYNTKEYNHLKKHIFNFLYSSKNHVKSVSIYKKESTYIIKGKATFQKISYQIST